MKEERKGDTESVVRWWDCWRNSREKKELGFPKRLRGEREAHHGEYLEKEIVGHRDCESRVAGKRSSREEEERIREEAATTNRESNTLYQFCLDHHGPPKVNFWEDPLSPSKWKEEHLKIRDHLVVGFQIDGREEINLLGKKGR
ncbi:hypothetical protein NE237_032848 [Protea cynaroides]|uniref:Uncharacterized protein n=1 Tax=Protea cynaroides TaxID=273540 RepID=A0A9Q0L5E7_9MAGN|nr:hypothetical protein NE237_032848 [Protea cynaroides]